MDRRIISILYHNGIFDLDEVEKYVGEKDNYYEVIIDGELRKLQIPGFVYPNDERRTELKEKMKKTVELAKNLREPENEDEQKELDDIYNDIQDLGKFLDDIKEKNKIEPELENSFEEEMKKSDDENEAFLEKIKKEEVKEFFKQPELEEIIKEIKENKKLIETKVEVKTTTKTTKKPKLKKPDDDIDDFLNTI